MLYACYIELKKLLGKRNICLFLLLLFGAYMVFFLLDINGLLHSDAYSYLAYQGLAGTVDGEHLPQEIERLEMQEEDFTNTELYTENYLSETNLYEEVLKQAKHTESYSDYVAKIIDNAQKGELAIFQDNAYIQREQAKTKRDFERLQSLSFRFASYRGVYLLARTDFADIFLLILIILLVASMIAMEKEEHTFSLLYSTYHGRKRIGAIKFFCGLFFLCLSLLLVYFYKAFVILHTYGVGGWDDAIQSVYQYASCKYLISIGQFLALSLAGRILVYFLLYGILFLFGIFLRKSMNLYCLTSGFLGLEWLCYTFLPEHSWLHLLKELNIFSLISSDRVIGEYHNISFFRQPVDFLYAALVLEVLGFAICMLGGICRFEKYPASDGIFHLIKSSHHTKRFLSKGDRRRRAVLSGYLFLFVKEIKKVWIGERGWLLLLAGCFALYFLYSPVQESFADKNQAYYGKYMQEIQGEYTEEKMQFLYREREELQRLQEFLASGDGYTDAQREIMQNKVERLSGLEMAIQNAEYVRQNEISHFVYEKGYLVLTGFLEGKRELLLLRVISLLFMLGLAASVWGIEEWSGMAPVLRSSMVGEAALLWLKRLHIALLSVLIFLISYTPWIRDIVREYHCEFWNAPMRSIPCFDGMFFQNITIGGGITVFWLFHLLYLYIAGTVVRLIHKRIKGYILTVFVSFILLVLPVILLRNLSIGH